MYLDFLISMEERKKKDNLSWTVADPVCFTYHCVDCTAQGMSEYSEGHKLTADKTVRGHCCVFSEILCFTVLTRRLIETNPPIKTKWIFCCCNCFANGTVFVCVHLSLETKINFTTVLDSNIHLWHKHCVVEERSTKRGGGCDGCIKLQNWNCKFVLLRLLTVTKTFKEGNNQFVNSSLWLDFVFQN